MLKSFGQAEVEGGKPGAGQEVQAALDLGRSTGAKGRGRTGPHTHCPKTQLRSCGVSSPPSPMGSVVRYRARHLISLLPETAQSCFWGISGTRLRRGKDRTQSQQRSGKTEPPPTQTLKSSSAEVEMLRMGVERRDKFVRGSWAQVLVRHRSGVERRGNGTGPGEQRRVLGSWG